MKYLKHFESINVDIDRHISTIESVLDDHLDEFPGAFTYIIKKDRWLYTGSDSSLIISIKYSPTSVDCPIIKILYDTKYGTRLNVCDDINKTNPFNRIYVLTNYKVCNYHFNERHITDLILKHETS